MRKIFLSLGLILAAIISLGQTIGPVPSPTSLPPNGAAGGYLSGTYPNPNVAKVLGTATNNDATAGDVGEYVSSSIASGSAISLTSNTPVNLTSISLTAGDWDVWINGYFQPGAATVVTIALTSISTTTGTVSNVNGNEGDFAASAGLSVRFSVNSGPIRMSLAAPTTVFYVVNSIFSISTLSAYGIIQARRVR